MGSVWAARDEATQATRIIKQLRLDAPELLEAFRGECALLSRLSHRHLVRVIDFGSARLRGELLHYYVAELIVGSTLSEYASRGALTPGTLLRPILDAVDGLSVLHEARFCHGDFTPGNVLVRADGSGVLIDLGLTRPFGRLDSVGGTEGFIAPELLQGGAADARCDSYAIGVTLQRCFASARLSPPAEVARLIERACREDPLARPADSREILEALGRRSRLSERLAAPAELVGRSAEVAHFARWFAAFRSSERTPRVLHLSAAPGMGSSRLFQELLWRAELEVNVLRAHGSEVGAVGRLLAAALEQEQPINSLNAMLAALPTLLERAEPLLLFVEDYERLGARERELLLSVARLLEHPSSIALVLSGREPPPGVACEALAVGPLSLVATREWARGLLSEERVQALHRATGGSPTLLETALHEADPSSRAREPGDVERATERAAAAAIAALSPPDRATLALISVVGGELAPETELVTWQQVEPLLERNLIARQANRVRVSNDAARAIASHALTASERSRAHLSAAQWRLSPEQTLLDASLRFALGIAHLAEGGDLTQAEALYEQLSAELRRAARSTATPLLALATRIKRPELALDLSDLLLAGGLPRAALSAASRAVRLRGGAALREAATLRVCDALVRLGRPARAELLLERQLARSAGSPEIAERLARARLSRADYRGAAETARAALAEATSPELEARLRETSGVGPGLSR